MLSPVCHDNEISGRNATDVNRDSGIDAVKNQLRRSGETSVDDTSEITDSKSVDPRQRPKDDHLNTNGRLARMTTRRGSSLAASNDVSPLTTANATSLPLVLLGEKPRGLYECDYCRADLTRSPRVRCAICPDFDLCLDCVATSDHAEMCRSRREFQRMHWRNTRGEGSVETVQPALERGGKKKQVKGGNVKGGLRAHNEKDDNADDEEEDDPNVLGYYHEGQWIPFFRHQVDHGYVVADSTRYMLFPPIRSVSVVDGGDKGSSSNDEDQEGSMKKDDSKSDKYTNDAMDLDLPNKVVCTQHDESKEKSDSTTEVDGANIAEMKICLDIPEAPCDVDLSKEVESKNLIVNDTSDIQSDACDAARAIYDKKISVDIDEQLQRRELRVDDDVKNIWTAEEDLRLLDGILTCGLGNWPEVAEHVNGANSELSSGSGGLLIGGKTDKMCMERYLDDFLGRYGYILPPNTMVPTTVDEDKEGESSEVADTMGESSDHDRKRSRRSLQCPEENSAPGFRKVKFRVVSTEEITRSSLIWPHPHIPPNIGITIGDQVNRDICYRSEQSFVRQCASSMSKLDAEAIRSNFNEKRAKNIEGFESKVLSPRIEDIKSYPGAELGGYMPRRGDFDIEWENDAEQMIADMEFSPEESKADQNLKVEVIKIFNSKLEEREKRRRFIIESNLLNYRENQQKEQVLPADERHLVHRMRLFARFQSKEEHQALIENILKAKRLRKEIAKLQTYRRLGVRSLADGEKYELDKSRREYHKMAGLKREAEVKKAEADAGRAMKDNGELAKANYDDGAGISSSQISATWMHYSSQASHVPGEKREPADPGPASQEYSDDKLSAGVAVDCNENVSREVLVNESFVLREKPCFDLLSSREIELCQRLCLLPQPYLVAKRALISDSLAAGVWDKSSTDQKGNFFAAVDICKLDNIIDFVLKAGWISTRPMISHEE